MAIGRRGFLKALGKGTVVGAAMATPAAYTVGVDPAKPGSEITAFNFTCNCGNNLIARVPAEESEAVVQCGKCGKAWRMVWKGDHFQTFSGEQTGRCVSQKQVLADDSETLRHLENLRNIGVI